MSSDVAEVREILGELLLKAQACKEPMSGQEVGMAILGLRNMDIDPAWEGLVKRWLQSLRAYSAGQAVSLEDIRTAYQSLALVVSPPCNLKSVLQSWGQYQELLETKELLGCRLQEMWSKVPSKFQSSHERQYFKLATVAYKGIPHVSVSSNEMLFGFESDLVIRISPNGGLPIIINVEVDGPHHKYNLKTQRFGALRDQHLQEEHGVRVVRWDLMSKEQQAKEEGDIVADFIALLEGLSPAT
jgi:hypothetical protein